MPNVFWTNAESHDTVTFTKENNEIMTLNVGDFITFEGIHGGARIEQFTYKDSDTRGPIGLIYLPWIYEDQAWAKEMWNPKGNPRHLVAEPVGTGHYGERVNWNTIQFVYDGVCPDEIPRLPLSPEFTSQPSPLLDAELAPLPPCPMYM
jgi:hypothetical protein